MSNEQYDIPSLYSFLVQTPESGLRKMLVDNKPFSEVHFNLMLKIVRSGDEASFIEHFTKTDFPKIKLSPSEQKIKEKFWADALATFKNRGLLNSSSSPKAA